MTSLTSPNTIMMNINGLDESGNTTENTMVQTNINFNVNVVNKGEINVAKPFK